MSNVLRIHSANAPLNSLLTRILDDCVKTSEAFEIPVASLLGILDLVKVEIIRKAEASDD